MPVCLAVCLSPYLSFYRYSYPPAWWVTGCQYIRPSVCIFSQSMYLRVGLCLFACLSACVYERLCACLFCVCVCLCMSLFVSVCLFVYHVSASILSTRVSNSHLVPPLLRLCPSLRSSRCLCPYCRLSKLGACKCLLIWLFMKSRAPYKLQLVACRGSRDVMACVMGLQEQPIFLVNRGAC